MANIKLKQSDYNKTILNKVIVEIIDEVISAYPFTFVTQEKIRQKIEKISELFWIKDNEGIYILVNENYSKRLGLKPSQVEGKSEHSFIPAYLISLYSTLNKYMIDSGNTMMLEGIPLKGITAAEDYQMIEVPLIDAEGKLAVVIGVGQRLNSIDENHTDLIYNAVFNLIKSFPKAIALTDIKGVIKQANRKFCKLFSDKIFDFRNFHVTNVLSDEIAERFERFINSDNYDISFEYDNKNTSSKLKVYLAKIVGDENQPDGILIFMEEKEENTSSGKAIKIEEIIYNYPEPVFIYDKENLGFLDVNQAALTLYGYKKDEFLRMDLTDLYSTEDIQTLLNSYVNSAKEGIFTGPYKHKRKDGSSIFVELSKSATKYKDKDASLNIVRDITDKLELSKKAQLYKTAFDNLDDLLFVTDREGFISFVNESVYEKLGLLKDKIIGISFTSLVKDDERGIINSSVFNSHINEEISLNLHIKKSNDDYLKAELKAFPVFSYANEIESYTIIAKLEDMQIKPPPVTEEKESKEDFLSKHEENEISEKILNTSFMSNVFHEILTPINVILGFVQEFTESSEKLSPEQKEALEIINMNRANLLSSMNSVIEFANIVGKKVELNIRELQITEVVDYLQKSLAEKTTAQYELAYGKISSSLKFKTDKVKFIRLISLLLNVFSKLSGEKKIYFSAYALNNKDYIVSLKDTHSVLSDDLRDKVNTFFNNDESSLLKAYGITKLTSQLSKNLLYLMKGRFAIIEGEGKQEAGFVFPLNFSATDGETIFKEIPGSFEEVSKEIIPDKTDKDSSLKEEIEAQAQVKGNGIKEIQPPETESKEPEPEAPGIDLSQLSCLYVEDQLDSQTLFKFQMKELKDIQFAAGFENMLPLLTRQRFDFIVMDINLPGDYNGLDILRIIRRMPEYESIPVVAVTAYMLPGDRERFIAAGFNDFIPKPVLKMKMIDSLEKIFLAHA